MSESNIESPHNLEQRIINIYNEIDRGQFETLFDICDDNIVYERDGLENDGHLKIDGLGAFKNFYNNERKLTGIHNTESVQNDGNSITVTSSFEGTNDGTSIKLRYKDTWVFNTEGKVTYRLSQIVRQS